MHKRIVDIVVVSDVHLGTYGCHAEELNQYLKSVQPRVLVLNGDIIDIWQFSKSYFPKSHIKVIRRILKLVTQGTQVYYITGNHDEFLRKFESLDLGQLKIVNQLVLKLQGKNTWFVHGDVFDVSVQQSKWLAKLGSKGYDYLILLNRFINKICTLAGYRKVSISKKVKHKVKKASMHISNYESMIAQFAASNDMQYVVCGHIHEPLIKELETENKKIMYLNSGDWIENLTALEYHLGSWSIYHHTDIAATFDDTDEELIPELFNLQHIAGVISS